VPIVSVFHAGSSGPFHPSLKVTSSESTVLRVRAGNPSGAGGTASKSVASMVSVAFIPEKSNDENLREALKRVR
jgi:hypothetical protein